jgi:uncharacterized protein related to proFAR isomerase
MSSNRIGSARSAQRDVYERLSKRLDNLTAVERMSSNAEKIALLRKVYFADVDELERSGAVKLPQ